MPAAEPDRRGLQRGGQGTGASRTRRRLAETAGSGRLFSVDDRVELAQKVAAAMITAAPDKRERARRTHQFACTRRSHECAQIIALKVLARDDVGRPQDIV